MFNHREKLEQPCPKCGKGPEWILTKMIDSAGKIRYPYICKHCQTRTQLFEKKSIAESVGIFNKETIIIQQRAKAPCEVCGKYALLEKHHWAPYKYFEDAYKWPTSNLCRECHEKWHQVMTGDLIRKT